MAEFGELAEVPQPSSPDGLLSKQNSSGTLCGYRIPIAWLRTGDQPGRSLLQKVASALNLGSAGHMLSLPCRN